jgi:hypothetical protein
VQKTVIQYGAVTGMTDEQRKVVECYQRRYGQEVLPVQYVDAARIPNPYRKGVADDVLRQMVRDSVGFEGTVWRVCHLLGDFDLVLLHCKFGRHRSIAVAEEVQKRHPEVRILYQNAGVKSPTRVDN